MFNTLNLVGVRVGRRVRVRRRRAGRGRARRRRAGTRSTEKDRRDVLALENGGEELGVVILDVATSSLDDLLDVISGDRSLVIVEDEGGVGADEVGTLVVGNSEGH